ncbi:CoA ester lyase [Rhodoferax sp.]|uniref:HpcH/HpaI aldolase/citrate lyase family protein n=1 Tax=Rhodoferax sp. TaxID=50421 RepID=UPI0025FB585A|nr:CoA ester lyase [Rhodoferax sp.]MCM2341001.1 CoA ester lyase [Rhodoferax sp.]
MSARSVLALARSFLFVPANRPDRFAKALASGADVVIIDLEDAVAADDKAAARDQLADAFGGFSGPERGRLLVRINASGTPWFEDDLKLLRLFGQQGLAGVMVPKAETISDLQCVAGAVGPDCGLLPQVESVLGLDGINALALAPQVQRLAFGNLDFQADAGLACDADEAELMPVRLALLLASRRAALPAPVDGVTPGTQDSVQLQADAARSRRGGFGGKLCIHPAQVALVNAAFAPDAAELAWAQRVMAALAAAGGGVFRLDGRMVDAPVVRLAQHTLARGRPPTPAPGEQP